MVMGSVGVHGGELDLATIPLFAKANVPPNILFLFDNSGSMHNIVQDSPYDPNDNSFAVCPAALAIDAPGINGFGGIDVAVQTDGLGYFSVIQDGVDPEYDWGNDSAGTGIGGRTKACFDASTTYPARLYANQGGNGATKVPESYLAAEYTGHYLNWYFGSGNRNWGANERNKPATQRRIDLAQNTGIEIIDSLQNVRAGLCQYSTHIDFNTAFDHPVEILIGVDDIAGNREQLKTAIGILTPTALTPLAESLKGIGRYFVQGFNNSLTLHPGQPNQQTAAAYSIFDTIPEYAPGVSQTSPIEYYCQKNFVVILTDGRPQADQSLENNPFLRDYDGDCADPSANCAGFDRKPGRQYESTGSDHLDDVAKALNEMDLRPDLDSPDNTEVVNNIDTHIIGFADQLVINDPLMTDTANNGGGLFLPATNAEGLAQAFQDATQNIFDQLESSSASVSFNSTSVQAGARAYQGVFDSNDWSGKLLSFALHDGSGNDGCSVNDPIGATCGAALWEAGCILTGGACEGANGTPGATTGRAPDHHL